MSVKIKKTWKFISYLFGILVVTLFSALNLGSKANHKSLLGDNLDSVLAPLSTDTAHADVTGCSGDASDTQDCGTSGCGDGGGSSSSSY